MLCIIRLLLLVFLFVPSLHQTNKLRDALSDWTGNASSSIKTAIYDILSIFHFFPFQILYNDTFLVWLASAIE